MCDSRLSDCVVKEFFSYYVLKQQFYFSSSYFRCLTSLRYSPLYAVVVVLTLISFLIFCSCDLPVLNSGKFPVKINNHKAINVESLILRLYAPLGAKGSESR